MAEKAAALEIGQALAALAALAEVPEQIAKLTEGYDEEQLHRKPAPEAWSVRDIVAHLRACAAVWGRSIERMIQEDHPTLRYVSPRGWINKTDYLSQSFHDSLEAFVRARADLIDRLRALDESGWSRGATFTGTTLGRDATVLSYARRIADHEAQHLDQIRRTLGG